MNQTDIDVKFEIQDSAIQFEHTQDVLEIADVDLFTDQIQIQRDKVQCTLQMLQTLKAIVRYCGGQLNRVYY